MQSCVRVKGRGWMQLHTIHGHVVAMRFVLLRPPQIHCSNHYHVALICHHCTVTNRTRTVILQLFAGEQTEFCSDYEVKEFGSASRLVAVRRRNIVI